MEEYEVGSLVELCFSYADDSTGVRIPAGAMLVLIEGPIQDSVTEKISWVVLSPGGILINVPQDYFSYDPIDREFSRSSRW